MMAELNPNEAKRAFELTCIVCPSGCRISVQTDGPDIKISGFGCRRGESYAREETIHPKRMVTGVVTVLGSSRLLSVKTVAPIPKELVFQIMAEIKALQVRPPVKIGQIIRENTAGTGVALVATKNID